MIIDIHSHCYKHPLPFVTRFLDPEELIKKNDELGIDKAVLLPVVNPEIYLPQSVDEVLDICSIARRSKKKLYSYMQMGKF